MAPGYSIQTGYNHVLCLPRSHRMKTRAPAVGPLKCVIVWLHGQEEGGSVQLCGVGSSLS